MWDLISLSPVSVLLLSLRRRSIGERSQYVLTGRCSRGRPRRLPARSPPWIALPLSSSDGGWRRCASASFMIGAARARMRSPAQSRRSVRISASVDGSHTMKMVLVTTPPPQLHSDPIAVSWLSRLVLPCLRCGCEPGRGRGIYACASRRGQCAGACCCLASLSADR